MKGAETWLKLLMRLERLNRLVKEPGWYEEDRRSAYEIKDAVIRTLLTQRPACLDVSMHYVPYFIYSYATKDKAGALMRADLERLPFEFYLSQVEPSPDDFEDPGRALIEVAVTCLEQRFMFHMPIDKITDCGVNPDALPRKKWVPAKDFHRGLYLALSEDISRLLRELSARD